MEKSVLLEISARHVHLSKEHIDILFGKDYELTVKKELSQPGQFACNERVDIVGTKNTLKGVSVLGPARPNTQVEISATDARSIGVNAFVRESGDIAGTAGCKIVGPLGEVEIQEGVIVAKRHIHLDPKTAEQYNVSDKQIVEVKIQSEQRSLVYGDVVIRVNASFAPAMHIDTDEGNAAGVGGKMYGIIL